jgi:hypothetical protein
MMEVHFVEFEGVNTVQFNAIIAVRTLFGRTDSYHNRIRTSSFCGTGCGYNRGVAVVIDADEIAEKNLRIVGKNL